MNSPVPALDDRFSEPEGWRWHSFLNKKGKRIRYGSVFPKDSIPNAIVVALPGLNEFAEKYYEMARSMLDRNLAFWVIDWYGQGRSDRPDPEQKEISTFEDNITDLHQFLSDYVFPASVHPDKGRIARVMLGHSAGGNIGLRYMYRHPDAFMCAMLSAPLLHTHHKQNIPLPLYLAWLKLLSPFHDKHPSCHKHTSPIIRPETDENLFSNDEIRRTVHNAWYNADKDLQADPLTIGWIQQAMQSCHILQKKRFLKDIKTPVLMAMAGQEALVSNRAIKKAVRLMPLAELLELPEAKHEIFMEKDKSRDLFLKSFDEFLDIHVLQKEERLKPF